MDMQSAIRATTESRHLNSDEMTQIMTTIMTGEATPAQIGGFLVGLRVKGETVEEIAAAASVMRKLSTRVDVSCDHLVDTCGTGGDGSGTFNISTAAAIVTAAAGVAVPKHGNRKITSKTGSADVLQQLGVNVEAAVEVVERCLAELGICFCFAPHLHPAMKHVMPIN